MGPVELHHVSAGPADGVPLLLGPSLGTTLALWDPQVDALSDRRRIVRFDLRGHGGSPAPPGPYSIADLGGDVLALLNRLGVVRVAYCGISLGAMVGMWLAAHAPERIERLVLVSTSAHIPPPEGWRQRARAALEAGSTESMADAGVARWLTPAYADAHPDVVAWLRAMLVGTSATGYAGCCGAIEHLDLRGDLPRIVAPTLAVAATGDFATPPDHARAIVERIPGARLEMLDDAAHFANVERAEEVSRLIATHLDADQAA